MPLMHTAMFGAPPASFDPTTVAGCELELLSDLGVTLSGSTVTAWADQSGNGRNATPVSSPTQVTNVQNGFPSVHLNGTSQFFTLASSAMQGANWTIFAVFKSASVSSTQVTYAESTTGNAHRLMFVLSSKVTAFTSDGTNVTQATDTTVLVNGTCYVATATSASGNSNIAYTNGDTGTSATGSIGAYTPTAFRVGCATTTGNLDFFSGDLLAIIVYNSVLGSTDRTYVRDGLKTLYAAY